MLHRQISTSKSNSFFLFGPRGTGKTRYLKTIFSQADSLYIDLLDPIEEDTFNRNPGELEARVATLFRQNKNG